MSTKEHKEIKDLDPKFENQNLRDHMTDLELIFSMLGEASTTEIARGINAQGFGENKEAARKGGKIAGNARKELETESGEEVVSPRDDSSKNTQGGHENLQAGDSGEPSGEPSEEGYLKEPIKVKKKEKKIKLSVK